MPRRQVKRGGRKFQPEKPLIYVFCEGESEQAYAKFLKEHFADVAVLKIPSKTGLFLKPKTILTRNQNTAIMPRSQTKSGFSLT